MNGTRREDERQGARDNAAAALLRALRPRVMGVAGNLPVAERMTCGEVRQVLALLEEVLAENRDYRARLLAVMEAASGSPLKHEVAVRGGTVRVFDDRPRTPQGPF